MPNRVLRDWTDSERINSLTVHAERFFTRLIMKVDDFGRYFGDTRILKANLFPLQLDSIREADISRWTAECQKAGLIVLYETLGKKYLQVEKFEQRLRQKREKYPRPTNDCHVTVNSPPESETKPNPETESETKPNARVIFMETVSRDAESTEALLYPQFPDFWNTYNKKVGEENCKILWANLLQAEKEKIMAYLPDYIESTPNILYRKNPEKFISQKSWNDEIISANKPANNGSNHPLRNLTPEYLNELNKRTGGGLVSGG